MASVLLPLSHNPQGTVTAGAIHTEPAKVSTSKALLEILVPILPIILRFAMFAVTCALSSWAMPWHAIEWCVGGGGGAGHGGEEGLTLLIENGIGSAGRIATRET